MRSSWFDEKAGFDAIQERASKLESFTSALADGEVSKNELAGQEQRLVAAMKSLEPGLNDDQHAKVTAVLIELTAYNVMRVLHELQAERARIAFGKA
jgi:predicted transcriptional regulator